MPALFAVAAAAFFCAVRAPPLDLASGGRDLGLFYQTHWLMAHAFRC
jgi:hypothetical protein